MKKTISEKMPCPIGGYFFNLTGSPDLEASARNPPGYCPGYIYDSIFRVLMVDDYSFYWFYIKTLRSKIKTLRSIFQFVAH